MYIQNSNLYKEYVHYKKGRWKIVIRMLSRLFQSCPNCHPLYIRNMNPEEQIVFDAKVVRLENEVTIRNKCIDKIYPYEWVYTYDKTIPGREFLKRYRIIVASMWRKLEEILDQYDFQFLFDYSNGLLSEVIRFQNLKRENANDETLYKYDNAIDNIYSCLIEATKKDEEAQWAMLYLYGFISREDYVAKHPHDVFDISHSRTFSGKKMMRKYQELPMLITYLYLEKEGLNRFSLLKLVEEEI